MALANVRERLALHFDAEASLESKVLENAYEVHIRMPYRTEAPGESAPGAARAQGSPATAARPRDPGQQLRTGAAHG
jgi:hypothetical protein